MISYIIPGGPGYHTAGLIIWPQSDCGRSYEVWCGVPTSPEPHEAIAWRSN